MPHFDTCKNTWPGCTTGRPRSNVSENGPAECWPIGQTIRRAEELITSGRVDVVIAEDLSRIYRNPRLQYDFVQNAVDNGCRVVCIADNLDTGTDHWEVVLGAAAFRHGMFIPDVRRRVRRSATHAFHNGGMVLRVRYGYRRLSKEEAASGHFGSKGLRMAKVPECTADDPTDVPLGPRRGFLRSDRRAAESSGHLPGPLRETRTLGGHQRRQPPPRSDPVRNATVPCRPL